MHAIDMFNIMIIVSVILIYIISRVVKKERS